MEYDQRVILRFLCKEGVSAQEVHLSLEVQFGEDAYSARSVRR
jgi:hypothetical protein